MTAATGPMSSNKSYGSRESGESAIDDGEALNGNSTSSPPPRQENKTGVPTKNNNDHGKKNNHHDDCASPNFSLSLWTSRVLFLACLCAVAACLGYGAHSVISRSEERLAEEHFDAIAERALAEAFQITQRKRKGAKALATIASNAFPDAAQWPNASMFGFERMAASIMDTAEAFTMGLAPLVWPEHLQNFEEFAYDTAFATINWDYPNTTGLRNFSGHGLERGVNGYDQNLTLYRVTDGNTDWGSKYHVIAPFIMHSAGPPLLMFDLHSMARFGTVIDEMLECAWSKPTEAATTTLEANDTTIDPLSDNSYLNECAMLSDMMIMYDKGTP